MKPLVLFATLTVAAAACSAAIAQDPAKGGGCIRLQNLRNHTVGDDHTLYFDYNGQAVYKLTSSNACAAGSVTTDAIVLHDRGQGMICSPIDWDISIRGSRCIVTSMTKLTPAEASALPKGKRP